ncbi:hypothetical protein Btru_056570 [Bulinus truncatus]|nr:hypothetical protein Btru_056570 [Bulinus truncatus]
MCDCRNQVIGSELDTLSCQKLFPFSFCHPRLLQPLERSEREKVKIYHQMAVFLCMVPLLAQAVLSSYHPWMEDLKGAQMIDPFEELFPRNSVLDAGNADSYPYWHQDDNELVSMYDDNMISDAHLRDEEHTENSDLHGFQSVSGGTAEGAPNAKQVKTDKQLPAYCSPPNPCPLGKIAAKDNCVENFVNSADNNQKLLSEQDCPCDTEHMFTCPQGQPDCLVQGLSGSQQMALNKVIDELSKIRHNGEGLENNPNLSASRKRLTLVAKKSPHMIKKRSEVSDHVAILTSKENGWKSLLKRPNVGQEFHAQLETKTKLNIVIPRFCWISFIYFFTSNQS